MDVVNGMYDSVRWEKDVTVVDFASGHKGVDVDVMVWMWWMWMRLNVMGVDVVGVDVVYNRGRWGKDGM